MNFEQLLGDVISIIWSTPLIILLSGAGVWFTLRSKFIQIRLVPEMIKQMFNKSAQQQGISSFQALTMALAGRVGTGNVAGVATAIAFGGPGAIFWMWVIAFFGASLAFIETTLGQIYKQQEKSGFMRGGPAYYIAYGLRKKKFALFFACLSVICYLVLMPGVQTNSIGQALHNSLAIPTWVSSLVVALCLSIIIIGGVKRIARFTEIVVPFMALAYIGMAFIILAINFKEIPAMFSLIVRSAFGQDQVFGGLLGSAILFGFKRGLFANEAGQGSQVAASSSADVSHPVKQGLVQAFSIYFDTFLVCTATALMILITNQFNVYDDSGKLVVEHIANITANDAGALYTQLAVSTVFGNLGPILVAITLTFFAFTTIMSFYYIAETNLIYLTKGRAKTSLMFVFRLIMVIMTFYGGITTSSTAWAMSDVAVGLCVWINIIVISILSPVAFKALVDYEQQLNQGLDPQFNPKKLGIKHADFWEQ